MKANSSEHWILNGRFITLMRVKGGKNLSVVKQHSRTGLLSRGCKKMEKAVVRTAEIHKILLLSLCVVSLDLIVLSSFSQKTIFIQRRKSYYGIKYNFDTIGNLLSTVISLTDLIRRHVENISHYKFVQDNGQIYLQMEMKE